MTTKVSLPRIDDVRFMPVQLTVPGPCNVRDDYPTGNILTTVKSGDIFLMIYSNPAVCGYEPENGRTWYPVVVNGINGWLAAPPATWTPIDGDPTTVVSPGTPAQVSTSWRDSLDDRGRKEVAFAQDYVKNYNHGTPGALSYSTIDTLAKLLDAGRSVQQP